MTVYNIPYNPQADPRQYFAKGFQNFVAGLNQRRESERFGQALGGIDPQAGILQAISQMLSGGATPQQAMGVGSMMQRGGAGRLGTVPGWWAYATPQQKQDYMNRVGGPLVQVGPKLLTPKQRQDLADKDYKEEMGLTSTELSNARKGVKTLVRETPDKWAPGWSDYSRDTLLDLYKQYRVENDYESKSEENRAKLDEIFDSQMATYNRVGHPSVTGKNEFDWDPEDERVQALRTDTEGEGELSEPKNKTDFSNTLRRLQLEDYQKAKAYYDKYLDKFY